MTYDNIEYSLVLMGWVIALLLGLILLVIKTPTTDHHIYYKRGKNTCAAVLLIFGAELLFQWLIRFYIKYPNPFLSVSVDLLAYCAATLFLTAGFVEMMSPGMMGRRQRAVAWSVLAGYGILLAVSYFLPVKRLNVIGILVACVLLLLLNCVALYMCVVVYRRAITNMRSYYSDVVEDVIRWMPGVGIAVIIYLFAAPIVCFSPRIVGVYQLALGIILFIYIFVNIVNFSFKFGCISQVLEHPAVADACERPTVDDKKSPLAESLIAVMATKERQWQERGGYHTRAITIDMAARDMGTNRCYLSSYLNDVLHVTFYEWVARMRITEAQSLLLADRDATLEQIADNVGFSSVSTFCNTFKKLQGMSPAKWRGLH